MNEAERTGGDATLRRCAVIFNPQKDTQDLRDTLAGAASDGWLVEWVETSADDPGRAMAEQALTDGVDLIIAAGGDGTVRVVAETVSGSGTPLALVPLGTGNLLARNLELPLAIEEAVAVALGDTERTIDLVRIRADDTTEQQFAVMAGVGLDAAIMDNTDDTVKSSFGSLAYVLAAVQQMGSGPISVQVTVDDAKPIRRKAQLCLIGNVGRLQGDVELIPNATADDGQLDVMIASPRRLVHWFRFLVKVFGRKDHAETRVDHLKGATVTVELEDPVKYQLDGDVEGSCSTLRAEIVPKALVVKVARAD